jgi:hypothetical protein
MTAKDLNADIITIQESKLTKQSKTPHIQEYTTLRKDHNLDKGGGLLTFVKNKITFTELKLPRNRTQHITEILLTAIHLPDKKPTISPTHPHPPYKQSTLNEETEITSPFEFLTELPNSIITGDHQHSILCLALLTD